MQREAASTAEAADPTQRESGGVSGHLLSTTSLCAHRQWEGKFVPAAARFPSLALPFLPTLLAPNPTQGFLGLSSKCETRSPAQEPNRGQEICSRAGFSTAHGVPHPRFLLNSHQEGKTQQT